MRSDMSKVIVERPRLGGNSSRKSAEHRKTSFDELPSKESMRRPHRHDFKSLNENLSPLRRFLQANVNRPWDKVYSEICENLNTNSAVQIHIRQHINDFVTKVVYKDNVPYVLENRLGGRLRLLSESYQPLYIDKNGFLRNVKRVKRKAKPKEITMIQPDPLTQIRRISGIWYVIQLEKYNGPLTRIIKSEGIKDYETPTDIGMKLDVMLQQRLYNLVSSRQDRLKTYYGKSGVYGVSRLQASSQILRKHNLQNIETIHAPNCPCKSNRPKKNTYKSSTILSEITCDLCASLVDFRR